MRALPLALSVSNQANKPRYPSFTAIMAAKKKPVQTWSLADPELCFSCGFSVRMQLTTRPEAGEVAFEAPTLPHSGQAGKPPE